jgi:prepilin-type N-terminal cleavage/methylation domain-containing protein
MVKRGLKSSKVWGFTLIELAIVLIVIGLLWGASVNLLGWLTDREKYSGNKEILASAVEAIKGYALNNKTLPTLSNFTSIVNTPNDVWGKPLIYIYYANATNRTICSFTGTPITVRYCYNTSCSSYNDTQNVAFIVLSSGENMNIQTGFSSQAISSNTTIKVYDYGIKNIDDYSADVNRPEPYDDMVKIMTLYELQSLLGCGGGGSGGNGSSGGGTPYKVVFNSPGTYTWVVPAGVNKIYVTGVAGGGGGGGGYGAGGGGGYGAGGGGGSGQACLNLPLTVSPGETLTITVGSGGSGGSGYYGTNGGNGGDTIISGSVSGLLLRLLGGGGGYGGASAGGGGGGYGGGYAAGGKGGDGSGGTGGNGGAGGYASLCLGPSGYTSLCLSGAGGGGGGYSGAGGGSGGLFIGRFAGGAGSIGGGGGASFKT